MKTLYNIQSPGLIKSFATVTSPLIESTESINTRLGSGQPRLQQTLPLSVQFFHLYVVVEEVNGDQRLFDGRHYSLSKKYHVWCLTDITKLWGIKISL